MADVKGEIGSKRVFPPRVKNITFLPWESLILELKCSLVVGNESLAVLYSDRIFLSQQHVSAILLDWGQSPYTKENPLPYTIIGAKTEILGKAAGYSTL